MKNKFYLQKRKNQITKDTAPSFEPGSPDQKAKTLTTTLWRLITKMCFSDMTNKNFCSEIVGTAAQIQYSAVYLDPLG